MCLTDCTITRRDVLNVGATTIAAGALASCATPAGVEPRDYGYERDGAAIDAFLAAPARPAPAVAVLHGNWGIPADVRAMAVELARHGFVALAVNPTSREPDHTIIPRSMLLGREFGDRYVADTRAGIERLQTQGIATAGPVAVWGYCGGGYVGLLWAAGAEGRELGAIVGAHVAIRNRNPDGTLLETRPQGLDLIAASATPMQFHQGGADDLTPETDLIELEALATRERKPIDVFRYPGAGHGFAMSTSDVYRADYAALANERGVAFLKRSLRH
jgi:carboxymethylenebutenolidase